MPGFVEIFPTGIKQLALAGAGEHQHRHDEAQRGIVALQEDGIKALRLLLREIPLRAAENYGGRSNDLTT